MSIERVSCMRAGSRVSGSAKARQVKALPLVPVVLPPLAAVVGVSAAAAAVVFVGCAAAGALVVAVASGAAGVAVGFSAPQAASSGIRITKSAEREASFLEDIRLAFLLGLFWSCRCLYVKGSRATASQMRVREQPFLKRRRLTGLERNEKSFVGT